MSVEAPEVGAESEIRYSALGERANIAAGGKRFKARFIEPGLVSYKDVGGGVDLVRKETIDLCMESMRGAALTIDHPSKETIFSGNFSDVSHGTVDKVEYDPSSGWFVCEGTVETDAAKRRIEAGDGISCGFTVVERTNGGRHHGIPYTQEDTRIKFHHLAIVPPEKRARYEEAQIRLNSMKTPTSFVGRLVQKITGGTKTLDITADTAVMVDGKPVTFETMIASQKALDERANSTYCCGPDDMIEHEGKSYKCSDLVAAHMKMNSMAGGGAMKMNETTEKGAPTMDRMNSGEFTLDKETEVGGVKLPAGKYTLKAGSIERVNTTVAETADEKIAREKREAQEAIDKRIKDERANAIAEERSRVERENAQRRGQESYQLLNQAALKGDPKNAPRTAYELGDSGSLDDGVALGRERYGRAPAARGAGRN